MFYVIQIKAISQRMPKPLFCKMSIRIALVPRANKLSKATSSLKYGFMGNWQHFGNLLPMMTSSNGNIFRVTGPLCGEFTGPGDFPTQRPVTRSFDVFFICARINDWVNKREAGDLRRYRGHYVVIVMPNTFYASFQVLFAWKHVLACINYD